MQISTYDMWSGDFPVVTPRGNVPDVGDTSDTTTTIASPGLEFAQERYAALQFEMMQNMDARLAAFEERQSSEFQRNNSDESSSPFATTGNSTAGTSNDDADTSDFSYYSQAQASATQNTALNIAEATRVVANDIAANGQASITAQANIPPQFAASLLAD